MDEVITFWVLTTIAGVLLLQTIVLGGIRLKFGRSFTGWDFLLVIAPIVALQLGLVGALIASGAGFYVDQIGPASPLAVERLTYLSGPFGSGGRVRVDTDQGVYFLSAQVPVPDHGTLYRVSRTRPWGGTSWTFLCPSLPPRGCWPTKRMDP